jgi:hypothetical protein
MAIANGFYNDKIVKILVDFGITNGFREIPLEEQEILISQFEEQLKQKNLQLVKA